jgi:aspartate dehydrogenase
MREGERLAVIGFGAIGAALTNSLNRHPNGPFVGAILSRRQPQIDVIPTPRHFQSLDSLVDWRPNLVVECAGHSAVKEYLPSLLEAGVDVILSSVGALVDEAEVEKLTVAADRGDANLFVVSGAIGGIDALRAASYGGLDEVIYVGRKPSKAWVGTPAAKLVNLDKLKIPTIVYEGTAREAAALYPRNANVTAIVALAGVGFDKTRVRLVADPTIQTNVHELKASGKFGHFCIHMENAALPDNPRSSGLAALSIEHAVRNHYRHLKI